MPTRNPGESKEDFMSRCIPEVVSEGKSQEQAIAICENLSQGTSLRKIKRKTRK